jgi:hypothetical protein
LTVAGDTHESNKNETIDSFEVAELCLGLLDAKYAAQHLSAKGFRAVGAPLSMLLLND